MLSCSSCISLNCAWICCLLWSINLVVFDSGLAYIIIDSERKYIWYLYRMYSYCYENAPSLKLNDPSPQMPCKLLRQLNIFPTFVVQFMRYLVWKIWSFKACTILPWALLCLTSGSWVSLPTQVQGLMHDSWAQRVMIYAYGSTSKLPGWNKESVPFFV